MENKTLGKVILSLRKEKNMTQQELAEKLNITDKAISKWERDLSYPDIDSLPKIAEIFDISIDELLKVKITKPEEENIFEKNRDLINLILKAVSLAMGVAVVVLSILKSIDPSSGLTLLAIAVTCIGILLLREN
ncbi:DNA-binding transcriptional regulator, XRE-family HTH domain [Anaerosphaera aminiphila DSM 21120]|uniref:DNA-binding transcriptional regulator, XRE-family HTH domain n=1 Tax=Anaerosphaera aminiphila DSM 21120 TaxID=1120995 RepID=A0A1M5TRA1_9FIRM|nr:helix-turn-helix transcriptional regulator [Anaerosphaera aminiphila]SHH53211.1 DNA-binding transcriptional regulator, XRE-family HTH domain [Anaerosphaera aminiphila DSM 21120]